MIRTLGCLPALIRPPFRCSTVPLQARARNGTTTATLRVIYPATNLGPGRATQHKDLQAAQAFYEKLGFSRTGGDGKGYLIMVHGGATVGLFQGMFEGNILTFNPGMRQDGSPLEEFTDVREIRESLLAGGIDLTTDTDPAGTGPAHIAFRDPDGNAILIDQFYPKPGTLERT